MTSGVERTSGAGASDWEPKVQRPKRAARGKAKEIKAKPQKLEETQEKKGGAKLPQKQPPKKILL